MIRAPERLDAPFPCGRSSLTAERSFSDLGGGMESHALGMWQSPILVARYPAASCTFLDMTPVLRASQPLMAPLTLSSRQPWSGLGSAHSPQGETHLHALPGVQRIEAPAPSYASKVLAAAAWESFQWPISRRSLHPGRLPGMVAGSRVPGHLVGFAMQHAVQGI